MAATQRANTQSTDERALDRRSADRHKLVLRIGLIEQDGRSIFCLVKNISSAGIQLKPFGHIAEATVVSLRVGDEDPIVGKVVWSRSGLAGVEFEDRLDPQALLRLEQKTAARRRRTSPRMRTDLRGCLRTAGVRHSTTISDLSMTGARLRTRTPITFGETTIVEVPGLPGLRAYVRWSADTEYGVSFQTPLPMQIIAELLCGANSSHVGGTSPKEQ